LRPLIKWRGSPGTRAGRYLTLMPRKNEGGTAAKILDGSFTQTLLQALPRTVGSTAPLFESLV
jgi:hypothetical protein